FLRIPTLYVLSMFGWFWVVLLQRNPAWKEVLIYAVAFVLALICNDFTRDFIMVAFPAIVFHSARLVGNRENARFGKLVPLGMLQMQMAVHMVSHSYDNVLIEWLRNPSALQ